MVLLYSFVATIVASLYLNLKGIWSHNDNGQAAIPNYKERVSGVDAIPASRGIPPHLAHKYGGDIFICDESATHNRNILNDDYCDCADGTDEPGTSACSTNHFICINKGYKILKIASSRVDDGVCDCCDGSDEIFYSHCENRCSDVAKLEKDKIDKLKLDYEVGSSIINQKIIAIVAQSDENMKKLEEIKLAITEEEAIAARVQLLYEEQKLKHDEHLSVLKHELMEGFANIAGFENQPQSFVCFAVHVMRTAGVDAHDYTNTIKINGIHQQPSPSAEVDSYGRINPSNEEDFSEDSSYGSEYDLDESESLSSVDSNGESNSHVLLVPTCNFALGFQLVPIEIIHLCNLFVKSEEDNDASISLLKSAFADTISINEWFREAGQALAFGKAKGHCSFFGGTDDANAELSEDEIASVALNIEALFKPYRKAAAAEIPFSKEVSNSNGKVTSLREELNNKESEIRNYQAHSSHLNYYSLNGECSSVRDGKFTYDICIMGHISQREDGSSSEVTIGEFESIELFENGEGSILKYRNGQHCHAFGPRSADVKVTCGAKNQILQASEPSTCFYSFTMESPAACTKEFALVNGILY